MFDSPRFRSAALLCLAAVAVAACGKKEVVPAGDLAVTGGVLSYVPADTPYLLASGAPLPDDVLDKIEPPTERVLNAYQTVLRAVIKDAYADYEARLEAQGEDPDEKKLYAVMDEFVSLMSIEELKRAGIDRDSRIAVYGNGLLPVVRFSVSDATLFENAIVRIETAAGEKMDTGMIDGRSYRYIGDDEASLIVALIGDHAVLTMAPADFGDAELETLLGLDPPQRNIVESGRLHDIVNDYGLSNHYVGFLDTVRLTSTFLGEGSDLDQKIMESGDFDADQISDVCKQEVREVAGIAPMIVFGYDEVSTEALGGKIVVAVRDDLASAMTAFGAVVPGLGIDMGGFGSGGLSFNLLAIRNFYEAQLDALDDDPYVCEHLQEMQANFAEGRAALQQPVPPMAYGFRGINIVVDDIRDLDFSNPAPPEDIDATVLVAMDDAPALLAMGAMFSPEIAMLDIQPDGTPVALEMQQVQMVADAAYAAMSDSAIAVAVGEGAAERASGALSAESVEPPLSMGFNMNASLYYQLMAQNAMDSSDDELPEAREAMREAMLASSEIYDRMSFGLRFTEQGVVIESRATLAD